MNRKQLTAGVIAGLTSLAIAVPAFAQVSGTSTVPTGHEQRSFQTLTAERLAEMIARDQAALNNADAVAALMKSATQAHLAALTAAQSLNTDDARAAAVHAAHEAMRQTIQAAIAANPDLRGAMMPHHGKRGGHGDRGGMHGPGDLAAKLGMTETELKAAIDSGKTIQQIATEKGVTLPARGFRGAPMGTASSSAQ